MKIESQINSFATSCYREILDIKRLGCISNEVILERINRQPLVNTVRRRQLGWLGHVLRRDKDEPARIFALYVPEQRHGKARAGRPRATYLDQVSSLLTNDSKSLTADKIAEMAKDKKQWRKWTAAYQAKD